MRERVEHQLGNVLVHDRIVFVFALTRARDESRVPEPPEPFRCRRDLLASRFRDVSHAGFMPAQDFH